VKFSFICMMCVSLCAEAFAVTVPPPQQVFVMAGQSNMRGSKGIAEGYPKNNEDAQLDKSIGLFWEVPDVNRTIGGLAKQSGADYMQPQAGLFGPEVSFSRLVAKNLKPLPVSIFKYSVGGTSLFYDWGGPGSGGLYDDMLKSYSDAFGKLRRLGHPIQLRGLIWVQGESDAENKIMAAQYYFRLKTIISHFRKSQGYQHLPVVLGVDEDNPWVKANPAVVDAQKRLAVEDPCIVFTSMKGLAKADVTHLTP